MTSERISYLMSLIFSELRDEIHVLRIEIDMNRLKIRDLKEKMSE